MLIFLPPLFLTRVYSILILASEWESYFFYFEPTLFSSFSDTSMTKEDSNQILPLSLLELTTVLSFDFEQFDRKGFEVLQSLLLWVQTVSPSEVFILFILSWLLNFRMLGLEPLLLSWSSLPTGLKFDLRLKKDFLLTFIFFCSWTGAMIFILTLLSILTEFMEFIENLLGTRTLLFSTNVSIYFIMDKKLSQLLNLSNKCLLSLDCWQCPSIAEMISCTISFSVDELGYIWLLAKLELSQTLQCPFSLTAIMESSI